MALTVGTGRRRRRVVIEVFTREGCGLCEEAEELVAIEGRGCQIRLTDIDEDEELQRRYNARVPVVEIDGREVAEGRLEPGVVRDAVRRARRGRWADWRRA